jgi:hypothetical protein
VFGGAYVNRSTVIYTQHTIDMTSNPGSMHYIALATVW